MTNNHLLGSQHHHQDSECTIDSETYTCIYCGVYHGDKCVICGGRGFHKWECELTLLEV